MNSPVTKRDIDNANCIFGPDLVYIRGGTTRTNLVHIRVDYEQIPMDFIGFHKYVTVIGHGIVAGNYLAKCHDSLNCLSLMYLGDRQSPRSSRLVSHRI